MKMRASKWFGRVATGTVSLGFVASCMTACSSDPGSGEKTEEGWGELSEAPRNIPDSELAQPGDVSPIELEDVDPVDAEEMLAIDDEALDVTGDDAPDVASSSPLDPEEERGMPALHGELQLDAAACAHPGPYAKYAKGAQLVTTDYLNLRTGAGTSHARITTMAPGTAVVVLAATCGGAWAHVRDANGQVGYSAVQYLRGKTPATPPPRGGYLSYYSPARGKALARASYAIGAGHRSGGYCLRGVRSAIDRSISPGFATGSPGASQFGDYARAHRSFMDAHHMHVYARGEAGAPTPAAFPVGTIMVYSAGHCGFHPVYGHVEIVVNATTACSDFCRHRTDTRCGPDTIILPRK
jgi:Bacterial SH3 domain